MRVHNFNPTRITLLSVFLVFLLAFAPRASGFTNGEAATLVIGQSGVTAFNPAVSQTALVSPLGEAFDSGGNLWVVDEGANRVLEYTSPLSTHEPATIVIGQTSFTGRDYSTSASGLDAPEGIAFDHSGNMWVVDTSNNRVVEYATPFSTGEAASKVVGQLDFVSNASATTATGLNQPEAVAFDSSGNMWVADALNSRVLEYPAPLSTGEAATLVLGEKNFVTAIDQVTRAGMSTPSGLVFDSSGNIWVADGVRVLEYTTPFATHELATIVIGQNTFTNESTVVDAAGLDLPWSLAFDQTHNLWVGDYGNNRVLEYNAPLSTGQAATVVIGQSDFTSNTANPVLNPTASSLNHPRGIAFDSAGDLLISDYAQGRVLGYGPGFAAAATSSSTTSGSSSVSTSTAVTSSTPTSTTSGVTATSTTSSTSSPPVSTATTSSSSSGGGGVPVFPYQAAIATVFTALLLVSYLLVRRNSSRDRPGQGPPSI